MACITECASLRIMTRRPRSASVSGSPARNTQTQPACQSAISASRVAGGSSNSVSRWRSGFSPSVVRKPVQRERMLPVMCLTMMAIELASGSSAAKSCSSATCAMAPSASFLYSRKRARDSSRYEVVNCIGIRSTVRYRDSDVAVFHAAGVIALDVERSGLAFAAIDGAAGNARNLLAINGGLAIADDGHGAPHQGHIVALPFARPLGKLHRRRQESIDRSHAVELVVFPRNLDLAIEPLGRSEGEARSLQFGIRRRVHAGYPAHDADIRPAAALGEFHPGRISVLGRGDSQVPAARERLSGCERQSRREQRHSHHRDARYQKDLFYFSNSVSEKNRARQTPRAPVATCTSGPRPKIGR